MEPLSPPAEPPLPPRLASASGAVGDGVGVGVPSDPAALRRILESLPPSQEVLDFYRRKVVSFEAEERRWRERLRASSGMAARAAAAEEAAERTRGEARALRRALVELQGAVASERKRAAKVQAENDRLKIEVQDGRRKVTVLLRACGQSEADLDRVIEQVDEGRPQPSSAERTSVLSDQLRRHIEDTKRTSEGLKLEIASLEQQLQEQERCHLEQVSTLENERRHLLSQQDQVCGQYERKAGELATYIKELDKNQDLLSREVGEVRSRFRRSEREWAAERETLYRKLQLCQRLGFRSDSAAVGAGFFTDQRSASRIRGDAGKDRRLQKANSEVAEQRALAEGYRGQLLAKEAEVDALREQKAQSQEQLKRRTKAMASQIESLRERQEELERRKRTEAEGYRADVGLLQRKIRQVEQRLVTAAVAKAKEHDYIKIIKAYERELEKLRTAMKKSPEWIS